MSGAARLTTTQAVARWARETPDAIAVAERDTVISYRQLAAQTIGAIRKLTEAGCVPGSIVVIERMHRYLHLLLILACEAIGAMHVSVRRLDLAEHDDLASQCDILCVVTDEPRRSGPAIVRLDRSFAASLAALKADDAAARWLDATYPDDTIVRVGLTSGTSGRAKNIPMTRRMVESIHAANDLVLGARAMRCNFICAHQLSITAIWRDACHVLRRGATLVLAISETLLAELAKFSPGQTALMVAEASRMVATARQQGRTAQTGLLRLIGGAAPRSLREALVTHLVTDVVSQYSSTESTAMAVMDDDDVGTLLPDVEARVVDEFGADVPAGEAGIMMVRSPRTCAGYLWNDAETRACFSDGWCRSSDIVVMPEPRRLKVIGRADDTINVGGAKIVPGLLETALRAIDGVSDAALLGVDNAFGVSEARLVIERRDARRDDWLRERIRPIVLRHLNDVPVRFITEMPRADLGKVDRAALRAALRGAP